MRPQVCPFLGLKDDPKTALKFPSEGNFCHHRRNALAIARDHQSNFCLSSEHITCPVYRDVAAAPPPPVGAQSRRPAPAISKFLIAGILTVLLLFAGTALAFSRGVNFGSIFIPSTGENTPVAQPARSTSNLPQLPAYGATAPTLSTTSPLETLIVTRATSTPTLSCTPPETWVVYTVQPTDSLFLLSLIYGVNVDELRRANCLDANAILRPGQYLFVPNPPTATPTLTPTNTIVFRRPTATQQPNEPPPPPPPSQPTATPPRQPTNTPAPTAAQPTPTNAPPPTNPPPPTSPPPDLATPTSPPPPPPPSILQLLESLLSAGSFTAANMN